MNEYVVIQLDENKEVHRYKADAPVEWVGMDFSTHKHELVDSVPAQLPEVTRKFGGRRNLTKLEFRSLFSPQAIKAIDRFETQFEQSQFLTDEQKDEIRTSFKDYNAAEYVDLDHPKWPSGLAMYVAFGYMTPEEVQEVLNG
jgi:hypothetical protein